MKCLVALGMGAFVVLAGCASTSTDTASSPSPSTEVVTSPSPTATSSPSGSSTPTSKPGAYIDYADYQANQAQFDSENVVLFFNASWCPTCQEAVKNFESETIPDNLVIVSVDYDSQQALRQKYGVTYQHTFVEVSPTGNELKKFSGSTTASQVEQEITS